MSELKENFIPQILLDYYFNQRTGILTIKQQSVRKTIHFENGNIVFATSNLETEQLGQYLLSCNLLTLQQLEEVNKLVQENRRFGKSLVQLGYFQTEALPAMFQQQIISIITSMFIWQNFDNRFTRCALPEYEVKNLISVPQILLAGFRELTDLSVVEQILGNFQAPLKLAKPLVEIRKQIILSPQEDILLGRLENITFNINEIIKLASFPKELILKTLATLQLLGYLSVSAEPISLTNLVEQSKGAKTEHNSGKTGDLMQQMASLLIESSSPSLQEKLPNVSPVIHSKTANVLDSQNTSKAYVDNSLDTRSAMEFYYQVESKVRAINSQASIYEVLEVDISSSLTQINASYQKLSNYFNPSRQKELQAYNMDVSSDLNYINTALNQAYQILITQQSQNKTNNASSSGNKTAPIAKTPSSQTVLPSTSPNTNSKTSLNYQEIMEFCYLIENKLNQIRANATHYQVLELERSATKDMIEQSYTNLMRQFDIKKQENLTAYGMNMSLQLEEISRAIRLAVEVLSNPHKRNLYDDQTGKMLRRNTGQYNTLPNPQEQKIVSTDNKYASPITGSKYQPSPPRPTPSAMPSLKVDSKTGSQLSNQAPKTSGSYSLNPELLRSNAGTRPNTNELIDPNKSSAGTKIPTNLPNTNQSPVRSNPGAKPSIVIDTTSNIRPTITPLAASRAQFNQPAVPVAQVPTPPINEPTTNNSVAKQSTPTTPITPTNELPSQNRPSPGGKSKSFTAAEYYLKSIEFCDEKKYVEAIEMLMMAIKISSKDAEYWAQLARAYNHLPGYENDAEFGYQKAIECAPRDSNYLLELGDFYRNHNKIDKAIETYQDALRVNPNGKRARQALEEIEKEETDTKSGTKPKGFWSKLLGQE